jgi:hypothetical protein
MARILTNKYALPDTIVKAVTHDTHKLAGDISVTTLIDAPKIRYLKRLHDYEEDVSDMLYALMGTSLHHILERANIESSRKRAFILTAETIMQKADQISKLDEGKAETLRKGANWIFQLIPVFFPEIADKYIFEITLQLQVGDKVLSGTFDVFDKETGILYDYKFCSVYNWIAPEARIKWERQTNIYAYMLKVQHGYQVNGIRIIAFFRDWNEYNFIRNKDYPDRQTKEIPIKVYEDDAVLGYIKKRMALHEKMEMGEDIECSGEERWAKADEFAVKQVGAKRAIKRFPSKVEADSWLAENKHNYEPSGGKGKLFIEVRHGQSMRCAKYCPVSKNCQQYQQELERIKKYEQ